MRERPLLMSGPMVRAILEGRKTQTRRVVTKVGRDNCLPDRRVESAFGAVVHVSKAAALCPHGVPGDRLWIRETAWYDRTTPEMLEHPRCFFPGGDVTSAAWKGPQPSPHQDAQTKEYLDLCSSYLVRRPSIHMPRWASRLSLEVTAVRAERLQAISEDDAKAEGTQIPWLYKATEDPPTHRGAFVRLWNSLNAKRGVGWTENPWVWVLTFKVAPR